MYWCLAIGQNGGERKTWFIGGTVRAGGAESKSRRGRKDWRENGRCKEDW